MNFVRFSTTTMREREMQCIAEFISIYRRESCLWQVKAKEYRNRNERDAAYMKLLEKLKEIDPYATKDDVLKKIGNLRTRYRKEFKKVCASKESGASPEEVYRPKLWYYKLLKFLHKEVVQDSQESIDNSDDDDITFIEDDTLPLKRTKLENGSDNSNEIEFFTTEKHSPSFSIPEIRFHQRPPSKESDPFRDEPLLPVEEPCERPRIEDRFDIHGKIVAMKMRELPKMQMIMAEKLINDVLFEAEMGNLTTSHQVCQTQPHYNSFEGVIDSNSSRFSQSDYDLNKCNN